LQECDVPPAFQVKQSAMVMMRGGMMGRGLTNAVFSRERFTTITAYQGSVTKLQLLEKLITQT